MQKDLSILAGNGKRYDNMLPPFDPSIIKDVDVEGFDSCESEDFDPGFGCVPVIVERVVPGPPEFTPELIDRLANSKREPKTTMGQSAKYFFKEQSKGKV